MRAFVLEGEHPHAAMIDSDSDGDVPFLWVGYWSARPTVEALPEVEVLAADSLEGLRGRRRFVEASSTTSGASLRGKDGALSAMQPYAVPGFAEAWAGAVDGAVVALCARRPLNTGVVVTEADEVVGLVRSWREMVDLSLGAK